jgi:hypothetical protein
VAIARADKLIGLPRIAVIGGQSGMLFYINSPIVVFESNGLLAGKSSLVEAVSGYVKSWI